MLELQNRLEREKSTQTDRRVGRDQRRTRRVEDREDRDDAGERLVSPVDRMGWRQAATHRRPSSQIGSRRLRSGSAIVSISSNRQDNIYDAIVTDAPYSISLHGYAWDSTEISFSPELWNRLFRVLKPGGYIAFFAAPRLYHRVADRL